MIDTEQLFLETVSNLRSQIVTGTPYKLTRASGLLRQLLIDDSTLLSQENRARHVKVRFPVGTRAPLNPNPGTLFMRGFGSPQFGTLIQATLDQYPDPDYQTQARTKTELTKNLKDLLKKIESREVPYIRKQETSRKLLALNVRLRSPHTLG